MAHCIIHIGMHKTGSTSIQHSLCGFSDADFLYPSLDADPNHSLALYSLFSNQPDLHFLHGGAGRDRVAVQKYISTVRESLERSIAESRSRTLILSGEDICVLPQAALMNMRSYLQTRVGDIMIVGYVRPPIGYITSNFQEKIKCGLTDRLDLGEEYSNYKSKFSKFDAVFGREKVHLWKYDPKRLAGGCVVQDFCSRLGISFPAARIARRNESLSRQFISLLYTYRKLGKKYGSATMTGPDSMKLSALLTGIGTDRMRFTAEVVNPILEMNRHDIQWMESRLGESLQEDLDEYRAGDVHDESDLLKPDTEIASKLLMLLGSSAPDNVRGETPNEVALLFHALREKYVPGRLKRRNEANLEGQSVSITNEKNDEAIVELIEKIRRTNPHLLDGIPKKKATAIVQYVFSFMQKTLSEMNSGMVDYPDLGLFRVRSVETVLQEKKIIRTGMLFHQASSNKGRKDKRNEDMEFVVESK